MVREIPNTAVEIQTGLWQELHSFIIGGVTHYNSRLYSSEGYCFYDKTDEYYDGEGNLIPDEQVLPSQRILMQYCTTPETTLEELNDRFVSILYKDGFVLNSDYEEREINEEENK